MIKNKEIICIVCPNSCVLNIKYNEESKDIIELEGAKCSKGHEYGKNEIISPMRTLTTTVKIKNGKIPLVSVRSDKPIPKALLKDAIKIINSLEIDLPESIGEVVIPNILDTGANIIVTKLVEPRFKTVCFSN